MKKCIYCGTEGVGVERKKPFSYKLFDLFLLIIIFSIIYVFIKNFSFLLIIGYVVYWLRKPKYRYYDCAICGQSHHMEEKYRWYAGYVGK
jgi:hypothetical protein